MLLSFDGGGSKTAVQLCDLQGRVLAEETIDTIDYGQIGILQVAARLKAGLEAVLHQSGKEEKALAGITVGLPRLGEIPAESRDLEQAVREVFPATARVFPVNDVVCAMYGALGGRPGICLLCGTGSMAMGMDGQGVIARAGGWSHIFSDQGSGYWLGLQAMALFAKEADGMAEKGPLYSLVLDRFGAAEPMALVVVFEKLAASRKETAALQRLLLQAAQAGDREAQRLYEAAAQELAQLVLAIRKQLSFPQGKPVQVSFAGGMFNVGPLLTIPLQKALVGTDMEIVEPCFSPVFGGILYAAIQLGYPLAAGRKGDMDPVKAKNGME